MGFKEGNPVTRYSLEHFGSLFTLILGILVIVIAFKILEDVDSEEDKILGFKETYTSEEGKLGKREKGVLRKFTSFANTVGRLVIGVKKSPREVVHVDLRS